MSTNRIIVCQVVGEFFQGAGQVIGAVGSHDDVELELHFSPMWEGTTKSIVWRDALGENPVTTLLTTELLVEGETEVYRIPVPAECKAHEGNMFLTVEGVSTESGIETRSVVSAAASFRVLRSLLDPESMNISASVAEQIQGEIDAIKGTIQEAVSSAALAESWAVGGTGKREGEDSNNAKYWSDTAGARAAEADESAANALESASNALESASNALESASNATESAEAAEAAQEAAQAAQTAAQAAQAGAEDSETAAAQSADTATAQAGAAAQSAADALASRDAASASAGEAGASAQGAAQSAEAAERSAGQAAGFEAAAEDSAALSESWAVGGTGTREGEDTNNARYWSQQAQQAAGGGDMLAETYDPQGKRTDIFQYVDEAIEGIDPAALQNVVTMSGGAEIRADAGLGTGPFEIEMDLDEDDKLPAAEVQYDNAQTQLSAATAQEAIDALFTSVSEGKSTVAAAITDMGVETAAEATFAQMAENIAQIETGVELPVLTDPAGAADVLAGKEAIDAAGAKLVGTLTAGDLLPALTDPGTAADLAAGKELIDANGAKVTGTITTVRTGSHHRHSDGNFFHFDSIPNQVLFEKAAESAVLYREGANVGVWVSLAKFGDATAADVKSGKTFTSAAGAKVTGTLNAAEVVMGKATKGAYDLTFAANKDNVFLYVQNDTTNGATLSNGPIWISIINGQITLQRFDAGAKQTYSDKLTAYATNVTFNKAQGKLTFSDSYYSLHQYHQWYYIAW